MIDLKKLGKMAQMVAEDHADYLEAKRSKEKEAHALTEHVLNDPAVAQRMVEGLVEALRPALPALCSPINNLGVRGVFLVCPKDGPSLVLLEDGTFRVLGQYGLGWAAPVSDVVRLFASHLLEFVETAERALLTQLDGKKSDRIEQIAAEAETLREWRVMLTS